MGFAPGAGAGAVLAAFYRMSLRAGLESAFCGVSCAVTGGAGFIGSNLVRRLLGLKARVTVIDNLSTGRKSNLEGILPDIRFIETDLRDLEGMQKAVQGTLHVFHLGAVNSVPRSLEDPELAVSSNCLGTANVLTASKESGVRRVTNVSSSSVYGGIPEEFKKETMTPKPLSPYAVSKHAAEMLARIFFESFGLDSVTLRYFNAFGPGQNPASPYAAVVPKFFSALLRGETPVIFGDGTAARDFTFVEDVVEGTLLAAVRGVPGETYNIGRGELTTVGTILENLYRVTGKRTAPVYAEPRPGDVYRSGADISKAKKELGYSPRFGIREGLERQFEWLKEKEACR